MIALSVPGTGRPVAEGAGPHAQAGECSSVQRHLTGFIIFLAAVSLLCGSWWEMEQMRMFAHWGSVRLGPSEDLHQEQPGSPVTDLTRDSFPAPLTARLFSHPCIALVRCNMHLAAWSGKLC